MLKSSKNRLTMPQADLFTKDTLFDRIARTVCRAGCLPRKELFEAWEVARRVRRRFRGGRVVDMACGHGLLATILLLLDDTSPTALAVDTNLPPSAERLATVMSEEWPRLVDRVVYCSKPLESIDLTPKDLVVSAHACGELTDLVLDKAVAADARVAVLPCCHDLDRADQGNLQGWLDGPIAVDVTRAAKLRQQGYQVFTQQIPADITPQNRLLMACR